MDLVRKFLYYNRFLKKGNDFITFLSLVMLSLAAFSVPVSPVYARVQFGGEYNLSQQSISQSEWPGIATSGNSVYFVWTERELSRPCSIYGYSCQIQGNPGRIIFSTNIGRDANGDIIFKWLSLDAGAKTLLPEIAVAGNEVYALWERHDGELYFRRSNDNGNTWNPAISDPPMKIGSGPVDWLHTGHMTASGNNVYIIWVGPNDPTGNYPLYFKRSNDNGATFSDAIQLAFGKNIQIPKIAAFANNIYIVWKERGEGADTDKDYIYSRISNDNGLTLGNLRVLGVLSARYGENIQVAASGNNLYVASQDKIGGSFVLSVRTSHDNGITFIDNKLRDHADPAILEQLAVSGNNVYIVWRGREVVQGNYELFLRSSNDNGVTFGNSINISNTWDDSGFSYIAALSNNLYIVWNERFHLGGARDSINFRSSTDGGHTFGDTIILSSNRGLGLDVKVAESNGIIHVVWLDDSTGNSEIFYKMGADIPDSIIIDDNLNRGNLTFRCIILHTC